MNDPRETMADYFEGKLDADQVAELEAWLRDDLDRARLLVRQAMLDCHLGELLHEKNVYDFTSALSDDSHFGAVLAALDAPEDGVEPVDITAAVEQREQQRQEAIEREEQARLAREREAQAAKGPHVIIIPRPVVWLALAAAVALVAFVGIEVFHDQRPIADPIAAATDTAAQAQPVGYVSASYNAAWIGSAPDTGQLIADQQFEFSHGMVELTFNDGGVVLIQAPAVFQATGPNAMRLLSGRLTANIPPRAHGFTVDTPHLNIVDLGTEFGVEVDPLLSSQADVFTGKVVATGLAEVGMIKPIELTQGLAAAADGQGQLGEVQPARRTHYYRSLSSYIAAPIVSGEGVYLSSPPDDVRLDATQATDHIFIFMERAGLTWTQRLNSAERIAAGPTVGQPVDVFLVHFDPEPARPGQKQTPSRQVTLTFDRPILGLIIDGKRLDQTDTTLGATQTHYPDPNAELGRKNARGIDLNDGVNADTYSLSSDRKTLTVTFKARDKADQMRIITRAAES